QELSRLLPQEGKPREPVGIQSWHPSPDGRWIAIEFFDATARQVKYGCMRTDGSKMWSFPAGKYAVDLQWNPVDRRLLAVRNDMPDPGKLQIKVLSYDPEQPDTPRILPNHQISNGGLRLGVTRRGTVLDLEELQWPSSKSDVPIHFRE